MSARPSLSAAEKLKNPDAFLYRTDLRELGLERGAIDAVFRSCPVIKLPDPHNPKKTHSRPVIQVKAFQAMLAGATYCDRCGDRVQP